MHHGYTLEYNKQGELLFVTEQTWTVDEFGFCEDPQRVSITEFRGNGRARYMVRERDPAFALDVLPGTTRWSDYDGDEIYGDYVVDDETGVVTDTMAYLPGVGQMDLLSGEIVYFHGDQIGSVRAVSDQQSAVNGVMVYAAFGEQVYADGTVGTRYQYAGAWGYESSVRSDALADLGWLHVGHRYYGTSTGRFLQRDPIGIWGGLNVYEYAFSDPVQSVDPAGDCIVIHWRGSGLNPGHTGLVTFEGDYISHVPCLLTLIGFPRFNNRPFWDDFKRYGIPTDIWVFFGQDEGAMGRRGFWWRFIPWSLTSNCVDCTIDVLVAGGEDPAGWAFIRLPEDMRKYIKRIGGIRIWLWPLF